MFYKKKKNRHNKNYKAENEIRVKTWNVFFCFTKKLARMTKRKTNWELKHKMFFLFHKKRKNSIDYNAQNEMSVKPWNVSSVLFKKQKTFKNNKDYKTENEMRVKTW